MRGPIDPQEDLRSKRAKFEELAGELGFTLHPASFEIGEHTDIGAFLGVLAAHVTDFETIPEHDIRDKDLARIKKTIRGWERLTPAHYAEKYTRYALPAYLVLLHDGVGLVEEEGEEVEGNDAFAERLARSPVYSPRKVKVKKVRVTHLGGMRVVATYTVDEKFADGKEFHGNAMAVLVKTERGWRIAIATDHLHETR